MTNIEAIEGEITNQAKEGKPYDYFTTITEKVVTGWLKNSVLARVGKADGIVTSREDSSSYGTCEICGSYTEDIQIFVDGEEVYSGGDSSGMDTEEYPNPFIKLNNWLNEEEN